MRVSMNFPAIKQSVAEITAQRNTIIRIVEQLQQSYKFFSGQGYSSESKSALLKIIDKADAQNKNLSQLICSLETVKNEFQACEALLSGNELPFNGTTSGIITTIFEDSLVITGSEATPLVLSDSVASQLDGNTLAMLLTASGYSLDYLKEFSSNLGDFKDLYGLWSVLADSDKALAVYEGLKDVKDITILSVAGYLNDGRDLINALNSGDADKLEGLIDKYGKKVLKTASGISGPTSGIYIDLGYSAIKNFAESTQDFMKDPSFDTAMAGVWNTTGMAFIDTGVGLAENTIEFVYKLVGKEFDQDDFNAAMDYLGNAIIYTAQDVGENIGEFIGETIINTGKIVSAGTKAITRAGKTVAKWFKWL